MKFLILTFVVCIALIAFVSAVPVEESIPGGTEGGDSEVVNPYNQQSVFLKLKLLKKLLLG